jgi:hypothetical protein
LECVLLVVLLVTYEHPLVPAMLTPRNVSFGVSLWE